jgi:hypothetical protein
MQRQIMGASQFGQLALIPQPLLPTLRLSSGGEGEPDSKSLSPERERDLG